MAALRSLIDTNESRLRHCGRVHWAYHLQRNASGRVRFYGGFRFRCSRCSWKSRVMLARIGAEQQADRHQLSCTSAGKADAAA